LIALLCPSGAGLRGHALFHGLRPRSAGFTRGYTPAPRWGEEEERRFGCFPLSGYCALCNSSAPPGQDRAGGDGFHGLRPRSAGFTHSMKPGLSSDVCVEGGFSCGLIRPLVATQGVASTFYPGGRGCGVDSPDRAIPAPRAYLTSCNRRTPTLANSPSRVLPGGPGGPS
jgi:hypothetical protein